MGGGYVGWEGKTYERYEEFEDGDEEHRAPE
jgi:hypothetical protein